jgi:hypothetical protein
MYSSLLDGCVAPDSWNVNTLSYNESRKYHGKSPDYLSIEKKCLKIAVRLYKNQHLYVSAAYNLGIGLHTIQDYYAHNIWKNGKSKPTYYNQTENYTPAKHWKFDNIEYYYNGKKWKNGYTYDNNPRIIKAVKRSYKYIKKFIGKVR